MRKTLPLIEGFSKAELGAKMSEYEIKSPSSGGAISDPMEFNLMFRSEIGPTGIIPSFLRPETAQGRVGKIAKKIKIGFFTFFLKF